MGNGAKAQTKRERAQAKGKVVAKSQLKVNDAAKNISCQRCRQTFLCTSRRNELQLHADKCKRTFEECFPSFVEPTK